MPWNKLIKSTQDLFNFYIRLRDKKRNNGLCFLCKRRPIYSANHFISAANMGTRFEEDNACGGCRQDNFNEFIDRRLVRKDFFRQKHIEMVGEARVLELEDMARRITQLDRTDIAEIRKRLHEKIARLGA